MSGNAFEWTSSFYNDKRVSRVVRGGSWKHTPEAARVTIRMAFGPDLRYKFQGFRLARN